MDCIFIFVAIRSHGSAFFRLGGKEKPRSALEQDAASRETRERTAVRAAIIHFANHACNVDAEAKGREERVLLGDDRQSERNSVRTA